MTPNLIPTFDDFLNILVVEGKREKDFKERFSSWQDYFDALKKKLLDELHQDAEKGRYLPTIDSTAEYIITTVCLMVKDKPLVLNEADRLGYFVDQIAALGTWSYMMGREHGNETTANHFIEIMNGREKLNEAERIKLKEESQRDLETSLKHEALKRQYLPNKKYADDLIDFFKAEAKRLNSQKLAYDTTAKKYNLNPLDGDSFLRQYRRREKALRELKTSK